MFSVLPYSDELVSVSALVLTSAIYLLVSSRVGRRGINRATFDTYPVIAGRVPIQDYTASYRACIAVDDAVALCAADPMLVAVFARLRSGRYVVPNATCFAQARYVLLWPSRGMLII